MDGGDDDAWAELLGWLLLCLGLLLVLGLPDGLRLGLPFIRPLRRPTLALSFRSGFFLGSGELAKFALRWRRSGGKVGDRQ